MMSLINEMLNFQCIVHKNSHCFAKNASYNFSAKNSTTVYFVRTVKLNEFSTNNFVKLTMV